jgi:nitroreductase
LDILDIIKTRRSIRKFEGRQVPGQLTEKVLEAGRWAPSGLNNQPWRFAVIRDAVVKEEFSKLTHHSGTIKNADTLIAVFLDNESGYNRTKDVQAVGACIQNMLLEAHSIGLGCVWLGEILKNSDQIRKILNLEERMELMAVLAVGYPGEQPKAVKRKELKNLIVFRR